MDIYDYARVLCKLSVSLQDTLYMLHKKGDLRALLLSCARGVGVIMPPCILSWYRGYDRTMYMWIISSTVCKTLPLDLPMEITFLMRQMVCDCSQAIISIWCIFCSSHLVTTILHLNDDLCVGAPFFCADVLYQKCFVSFPLLVLLLLLVCVNVCWIGAKPAEWGHCCGCCRPKV